MTLECKCEQRSLIIVCSTEPGNYGRSRRYLAIRHLNFAGEFNHPIPIISNIIIYLISNYIDTKFKKKHLSLILRY